MKTIILIQDAPVYIAPFLDDLLAQLRDRHEVTAIYTFAPYQRKGRLAQLKERYHFYGMSAMLQMIALILRNKVSSLFGRPTSVTQVLRKHGLSSEPPSNVNSPDFVNRVRQGGADVLISIACPQILKTPLLRALPFGCINYHTAALPRFRGRMPMFWALFHREKQVGISVHEMDEQIDNGPIIVQKLLPIDPNETLHSLYLKTTAAGPSLIVEALDKLEARISDRIANDAAQSTYFTVPTPKQCRQFRAAGGRFF